MSFFKKIFGQSDQNVPDSKINLSPEQFLNTGHIQALVKKYKRRATLLLPQTSSIALSQKESKFGGIPDFSGFEEYPCCDCCRTPLNFVLQLYKRDFPDFYFPPNSDLFQLFRCPNMNCSEGYSEAYDHKMYHYYLSESNTNNILKKPSHVLVDMEKEVPDCYLKPQIIDDFPNYDDFEENDFVEIDEKFGEEMSEVFMDNYTSIQNTKFGGYPSFTQSPCYPSCECGRIKEFFFQLSSEDTEEGVEKPPPVDKWSPHGIMIGDLGNIYYFVCKNCGPKTIETNWDCY